MTIILTAGTMHIQDWVNNIAAGKYLRNMPMRMMTGLVCTGRYTVQNVSVYGRSFPPRTPRTVEVGVGSGRFAVSLGIPVGIEPSVALGQMARRRGIEVIRGVGESLPLKDGSCSSVLMVTVICFFDDPARAFAEAYRVLVPGVVLVAGFSIISAETENDFCVIGAEKNNA